MVEIALTRRAGGTHLDPPQVYLVGAAVLLLPIKLQMTTTSTPCCVNVDAAFNRFIWHFVLECPCVKVVAVCRHDNLLCG